MPDKKNKELLVKYIKENKIGVTDLITNVINAERSNRGDVDNLTRNFQDRVLNSYNLEFFTSEIKSIIEHNKSTLKGVYFTRKSGSDIPKIWKEWAEIKRFCYLHSVEAEALFTPTRRWGGAEVKAKMCKEQSQVLNTITFN